MDRNEDNTTPNTETSYGGFVVRNSAHDSFEVVTITPRGKSVLALPKGGANPGESPTDTAIREVLEETGLQVTVREHLGDVQYWYRRSSRKIFKTVHFYLCDYVSGELEGYDKDEVDAVKWIPLEEARSKLSYPAERGLAEQALKRLTKAV